MGGGREKGEDEEVVVGRWFEDGWITVEGEELTSSGWESGEFRGKRREKELERNESSPRASP